MKYINLLETTAALAVFPLLLLHVLCFGISAVRWTGFRATSTCANLAVTIALGLSILAFEMLTLGYVNGWNTLGLSCSSCLVFLWLVKYWRNVQEFSKDAAVAILEMANESRALAFLCAVFFALLVVCGTRPPFVTDELEYHWAAPVLWAKAGHWVPSPYRLTNGPVLTELLYTFSAIFPAPAAAHWTHTLFLVVLVFAAAAMTKRGCGKGVAAIAACLACPLMAQAALCYNDVAVAALIVAAYTALVCERREKNQKMPLAGRLIAAMLLVSAVSVKAFALAAVPAAVIYCVRSVPKGLMIKALVANSILLGLPCIIALCLWSLHTYTLSGQYWDSRSVYIVKSPDDPFVRTGVAAGRIPTIRELAELPFVPVWTSVFGQREPYGGRTGLVIVPFVLLTALRWKTLESKQKQCCLWLLGASMAYFLAVGPFLIKTRFHIVVWTLLSCIAAIGFSVAQKDSSRAYRLAAVVIFFVVVLVGMTDSAHVLIRALAI